MHARKTARDTYFSSHDDDAFFTGSPRGDIRFADMAAARTFADRVNQRDGRTAGAPRARRIEPAELAAMTLLHEIFHAVVDIYRRRHPQVFADLLASLGQTLEGGARDTMLAFLGAFPPVAVYRWFQGEGDESPERHLERGGRHVENEVTAELILLWLTNQNPAYEPVRVIVSDHDMGGRYREFVAESRRFLDTEGPPVLDGMSLVDLLLLPSREHPDSIFAQLAFIEERWGRALGLDQLALWRRLLWARDFHAEEGRWFMKRGPGPGEPLLDAMRFGGIDHEPKRFSPDLDWMPHVVLIAKTVYVWLDQLSKKWQSDIRRLDQIPDEELDLLAARGFTGLWLIGLFERSRASRKVKQMRGDQDAVASAYSLRSYTIAEELGGYGAYDNLKRRAWARGIRLAADMVPNHVGIDGDWVIQHPEWFLQVKHPPYPSYRFGGPDLSEDERVGIFIEEGYWSHTDAAVVFRRHDRHTGEDRFIYHGNDGTSMPWNDTAQLDYTRAEVRHAVIETILHVARLFPIIRFDAAMTLAKRHYKRLWFPHPGAGDAIPSRADHAMTQEEFDRVFPTEFWREVVDAVAARAPDTLLLAEAFWMMEGYFVRTLGMHRVYNSAFMNMLKREENEKYRQTIKNVLDFDPEILKRFVNFMNNPDEETAIAQFGEDDKYFGVATLMSTMPGLPMFGHGQIEGLREKYGMEYRRAKWDEHPNGWLVSRHEREIFPVLKKRYLFSGVASFALYDFCAEGGGVDEDVFAYSNRAGDERALVLYNNKWKTTRGRVHGSTHRGTLAEEIGVDPRAGEWLAFRDLSKGLEYLRPSHEVGERGLFWELQAFKYHVFSDFRALHATVTMPYDRLAAELAGGGVPSLDRAARELYLRPIHAPLRSACSKGHLAYLRGGWDAEAGALRGEAVVALEERIDHVADGLEWMIREGAVTLDAESPIAARAAGGQGPLARAKVLEEARALFAAIVRDAAAKHEGVTPDGATSGGAAPDGATAEHEAAAPDAAEASAGPPDAAPAKPRAAEEDRLEADLLLAWLHLEATLDLLAETAHATERGALVDTWELATPLVDALGEHVPELEGRRRAALVLLAATLPPAPLARSLRAAFEDARARTFMNVHEAGGVVWLVKERFEELVRLLGAREVARGRVTDEEARAEIDMLVGLAERHGYRAERIAADLPLAPERKPSRDVGVEPLA